MLSYQELDQEARQYGADIYVLCENAKPRVAISNVPRWKKGETSPTSRILERLEKALNKIKKQKSE